MGGRVGEQSKRLDPAPPPRTPLRSLGEGLSRMPCPGQPGGTGPGRGQEPAMDSLKCLETGLGDVLLVKLL